MRPAVFRALLLVVFVSWLVPREARAAAYACTPAGVSSAVAAGGSATFTCTAATTVTLAAPLTFHGTTTVLDGGGLLTISGGGTRTLFTVPAGVRVTLQNVTIADGFTTNVNLAGCIQNYGTLTISNSTLTRCLPLTDQLPLAGAIYSDGSLTLTNSSVVANGGGVQGAIGVGAGTFTMTSSTVGGNGGRGLVAFAGTLTISYSTIANNGLEGVLLLGAPTATVTSTLAANNGAAAGNPDLQGTFQSGGYNLVSKSNGLTFTGTTTGNQIGRTPLLGPLANNGGPTMTYALLACSPGINGGLTSGGPGADQRGGTRIVNGAMDIGAYESTTYTCLAPTADVAKAEGNAGTSTLTFTIHMSAPISIAATVNVATANSTAIAGSDYAAASGTLTFAPGETDKTVAVTINGDTVYEGNETFALNLGASTGAIVSDAQAIGTIVNDDAQPGLSVADVSVTEGNAGTKAMTFTVALSGANASTVIVNYATTNGTATTADADYVAASGTLAFAPGETAKTVAVTITGDAKYEPNETLTLDLFAASNATISDAQAIGTIVNDDAQPGLSVADVSVTEGNAGTKAMTFTVALSAASSQAVTVNYATANGTATTADADYVAASGTLTFAAGETAKTVAVTITGDAKYEPNETLTLNLSGATNATISDAQAIGTITNDDAQPSLSVADASVTEGNSGTKLLTFTVALSGTSAQAVTVNYATANGTATTADADYAAASGTLTFAAGETAKTVAVTITGDTKFEVNETFTVNLSGATNATVADAQAIGTITNDDAQPQVNIGNVSVTEGDTGTVSAVLTVMMSASSYQTVTVNFATSDNTATAGQDYTAAMGTLTFAPGDTAKTITVPVIGDELDEPDETFFVTLSGPTNVTLGAAIKGTGTIVDDEARPGLAVGDVSAPEGNMGTAPLVFTVTLSGASADTIEVDYATADATATAGQDYTAASGTLTFAPGEVSKTIEVTDSGDTTFEPDETFTLTLSNPTNADIATATGTATIQNDDGEPTVSVAAASVVEGDVDLVFTVTLSVPSSLDVSVDYATSDDTATADQDYTAASGTLTFAPGETSATVHVGVRGDAEIEGDETFTLTLSNPQHTTLDVASVEGTILDDDHAIPDGATPDAGMDDGDDGAAAGGCCQVPGRTPPAGDLALMALVAIAFRRRRRG